jgi:hypothetical protein
LPPVGVPNSLTAEAHVNASGHGEIRRICDEYQHFATVGENEPTGDEKLVSLSRQPKCIPIIATQSISSLTRSAR